MCSHYEAPSAAQLMETYGVATDSQWSLDLWPGGFGAFLRCSPSSNTQVAAAPNIEALPGIFGLLPSWAKDERLARRTYNARSETVATKPSYRAAWRQARHCIIPALAIYEPDWRSGRAIPTRITRRDGAMMNIAGLWEHWTSPTGKILHSYTMLTINADNHPLMCHFHRHRKEKRMIVLLTQDQINDWLTATSDESTAFLQQYPAELLDTEPQPTR